MECGSYAQLILDDPVYRLGRDSQATGNLLRRAADQRAEHELLEAISVGYVLAFERGDNVLPVVTPRTAMEGSLVNPETGLLSCQESSGKEDSWKLETFQMEPCG